MSPLFFLATLCLAVVSAAPTHDPSLDAEWHEWKTRHGKTYITVGAMKTVYTVKASFFRA